MGVKFSKVEISEIMRAGTVKGGNLVLPIAWLTERESGTRVKSDVKVGIFSEMLESVG